MSLAMNRHVKPAVISILALIIVFSLLYTWRSLRSSGAEQQTLPPIPVTTIRAKTSNVADQLQAVASLQAVREVLLAPDTSGRVTAINFESGQFVKEGDAVIQLYDAPNKRISLLPKQKLILRNCNFDAHKHYPKRGPSPANFLNSARRKPPRPQPRSGNLTHVSSRRPFVHHFLVNLVSVISILVSTLMRVMKSPR